MFPHSASTLIPLPHHLRSLPQQLRSLNASPITTPSPTCLPAPTLVQTATPATPPPKITTALLQITDATPPTAPQHPTPTPPAPNHVKSTTPPAGAHRAAISPLPPDPLRLQGSLHRQLVRVSPASASICTPGRYCWYDVHHRGSEWA